MKIVKILCHHYALKITEVVLIRSYLAASPAEFGARKIPNPRRHLGAKTISEVEEKFGINIREFLRGYQLFVLEEIGFHFVVILSFAFEYYVDTTLVANMINPHLQLIGIKFVH